MIYFYNNAKKLDWEWLDPLQGAMLLISSWYSCNGCLPKKIAHYLSSQAGGWGGEAKSKLSSKSQKWAIFFIELGKKWTKKIAHFWGFEDKRGGGRAANLTFSSEDKIWAIFFFCKHPLDRWHVRQKMCHQPRWTDTHVKNVKWPLDPSPSYEGIRAGIVVHFV